MPVDLKERNWKIFYKNFLGGVGWGLGVTIGATLILALLGSLLRFLGGLPVIGQFFAGIIEATESALNSNGLP
ncbi:MAG: DUF5665 domain-containing protein [Patescibacteria group bacterium]|jgi:hypothetical protein